LLLTRMWQAESSSDEDTDDEGMVAISRPRAMPIYGCAGKRDPCPKVAWNSESRSSGSGSGRQVYGQKQISVKYSDTSRSSTMRLQTPPLHPAETSTPSEKVGSETEKVTPSHSKLPRDSEIILDSGRTGNWSSPSTEVSAPSEAESLAQTSTGSLSTMENFANDLHPWTWHNEEACNTWA
jgi:hypothetical protein